MAYHKIRNKQTGEVMIVEESQLSQYGLFSPQQEVEQPVAEKKGLTDFLFPQTKKTGEMIGTGIRGLLFNKGANEDLTSTQESVSRTLALAKKEKDPAKRERLLRAAGASQDVIREIGGEAQDVATAIGETGLTTEKGAFGQYANQGLKTGTELGAWLAPAGTAKGGIQLTKGTSVLAGKGVGTALARGAVTGSTSGLLFGLSDDEANTLGNLAKSTATGALIGSAVEGLTQVVSNTAKTLKTYVTEKLPKASRLKGLGGVSDLDFAQETLDKKAPGSYRKMVDWGEKLEDTVEEELKKIDVPGGISLEEILPDKRFRKDFISQDLPSLARELKGKRRYDDAQLINGVASKLKDGDALTFEEALNVKRLFDNSARTTFNLVSDNVGAQNKAARRVVGDMFREAIRNSDSVKEAVGSMVADLLDTQRFSIKLQGIAESAANRYTKQSIPSWMQMTVMASPLFYGPSGVMMPGAAAVAGERIIKRPQTHQFLYNLGQKEAPKIVSQTISPAAMKLKELFTKGAIKGFGGAASQ